MTTINFLAGFPQLWGWGVRTLSPAGDPREEGPSHGQCQARHTADPGVTFQR